MDGGIDGKRERGREGERERGRDGGMEGCIYVWLTDYLTV